MPPSTPPATAASRAAGNLLPRAGEAAPPGACHAPGVDLLRTVTAPLRSADTYRRWVHLVLGGALYVPFAVAVLVVATLPAGDGVGSAEDGFGPLGVVAAIVAAALGGATVWIPSVRTQQHQLARSLIRGPIAEDPVVPADSPRTRWRAAVWTALHLVIGFVVSLVTMAALTEAALLALSAVAAEPTTMFSDGLWFLAGGTPTGAARLFGPATGALLVVATIAAVALVGAGAARLAPALLGPSTADRLAAAETRATQLTHRSHLATELHDSIGHALSVVALQAGTAARVMDRDPEFTRRALEAIAEQARDAAGELDLVLGALRDQQPTTAPRRTLADLPQLLDTARTAGADVSFEQQGALDTVPTALSREAYRLCQEGLTNALRHGVPDAPIDVTVAVEDARLRLAITNRAPTRRSGTRTGGGQGLVGMRERIAVLGGELESGVRGGTWHLAAAIPLEAGR